MSDNVVIFALSGTHLSSPLGMLAIVIKSDGCMALVNFSRGNSYRCKFKVLNQNKTKNLSILYCFQIVQEVMENINLDVILMC